jgi:2-polyprenyl-3-methyl-5-hydroxy-6-metoxy-1,4-benzoquinol methylase
VISNAYFDRFETPKYRNDNPLQRILIRRFVERLHSLFISACPLESVLEVGVGEGFLSGYLSEKFPDKRFTGVDIEAGDLDKLRAKFDGIETHQGSVYDLAFLRDRRFDLVICAEVLEHLERPEDALDQILALSPKRVIFSVPHEPWFMLSNLVRGKNVSRWGNDIEHLNHWGTGSFRKLLEPRFEIHQMTASYPWLLALLEPR